MSEYKEMFVEEAREHLQTLNQTLVDFEENPKDAEAMNKIFRAAHTLKGMAAAMNYNEIQSLSHKTEDTLDLIRNNQIDISTDLVDLIFNCFDGLETMVEEIAEADQTTYNIKDLIGKLEHYIELGEQEGTPKKQAKQEKTTPASDTTLTLTKTIKNKIKKEIQGSNDVFKIDITVDEACKMKSIRAFLLLKKLHDMGDIISSDPKEKAIEDGAFEQNFTIYFTSQNNINYIYEQVDTVSELSSKVITPLIIEKDEIIPDTTAIIQTASENKEEQPSSSETDSPTSEQKDQKKKTPTTKKPPAGKQSQSIRVDMNQLDDFMNLIGELVISKGRLGQIAIDHNIDELSETINTFDRLTTDLQDKIMNIRMIPMSHIFNRFPRMIRDLAKGTNKKINLNIEGEGIELDRTVLDKIGDPLVHLLRNSVDHGVETPEERKQKGKPEEGRVDLIAERKRNHVLITVSDDGKGISADVMRNTAVKKGLKTEEEVATMDDRDALNLLWLPGLSSSETITNVSGRGVGMDVVKSTIEKLNGVVEFTTEVDKGSTFSLKLPLTMAIFKSLFVGIGGETYAIPISNIIETVRITEDEIKLINGKEIILLRNRVLPLSFLKELLGQSLDNEIDRKEMFTVVIQKEDKQFGLIVNKLIGEQEITIKNVGGAMKRTKGIAGVTITGDGKVILVLDINTLVVE